MSKLYEYINGGYMVTIFEDGTKIRHQISDLPPKLPEHMDLKITNWCDAGCGWCHENSTLKGKHGDLSYILNILRDVNPGFELAIGGGDAMSHPELDDFLTELKKTNIIANITVNGKHLERHKDRLNNFTKNKLLYGVGVSWHNTLPSWDYEHMVIHMIAGIHHPKFLDTITDKKILLLGFKQHGRGININQDIVQNNINSWYREIFQVAKNNHMSFDNLAIEQIKPQRLFINPESFNLRFMGEEGKFGMYMDAVTKKYALSSYSNQQFKISKKLSYMFSKISKSNQSLIP